MRIISSFHDYYDSVMAMDGDRELVYERKPEIVDYPAPNNLWSQQQYPGEQFPLPVCFTAGHRHWNDNFRVDEQIVGFCGRIYPSIWLLKPGDGPSEWTQCKNTEEVDAFVKEFFTQEEYDAYRYGKYWRKWQSVHKRRYFQEFFAECEQKKDAFRHLFEEHHSPIFVARVEPNKRRIEYNASLKDVDFFRVFDAYTTYQEISMFMGGLAVPQKEMPKISDETMSEIKGFDKWSFRKEPKGKK